jgi:hypothetical protein
VGEETTSCDIREANCRVVFAKVKVRELHVAACRFERAGVPSLCCQADTESREHVKLYGLQYYVMVDNWTIKTWRLMEWLHIPAHVERGNCL